MVSGDTGSGTPRAGGASGRHPATPGSRGYQRNAKVFGVVEFSADSVLGGVLQLVFKTMYECIRLRRFGRCGFQQIQVRCATSVTACVPKLTPWFSLPSLIRWMWLCSSSLCPHSSHHSRN